MVERVIDVDDVTGSTPVSPTFMKILSIETSCDDTGITIMEVKGGPKNASFKVLANGIISQNKTHAPHGGVFPALAKRDHIKNLPILLDKMLKKAKLGVRQDLTQKGIDPVRGREGSQRASTSNGIKQFQCQKSMQIKY